MRLPIEIIRNVCRKFFLEFFDDFLSWLISIGSKQILRACGLICVGDWPTGNQRLTAASSRGQIRLAGLTLSLYPLLWGLPLKNILCNNFCCCGHLPAFSIGYTALNILHIQGLLYVTPYVFKFYSGKYQVQDCSYFVTYIVCRKNIVFGEKNIFLFSTLTSDGQLNTQI